MEKVSVILPTYNSAEFLPDAITSVLSQTYKQFELIVVDDGSTDNTVQVIKEYLDDNRVSFIHRTANHGVAAARNLAIDVSEGEFLAFIDADDVWEVTKLECQLRFMKKERLDFSYSYYDLVNESLKTIKVIDQLPTSINYKALLRTNSIPILTVVLRKKILNQHRFKNIKHEDYALWLSVMKSENINIHLFPRRLAKYRIHGESLSQNKFRSALWVWKLYRSEEKMSIIKSTIHMLFYTYYGVKKHIR